MIITHIYGVQFDMLVYVYTASQFVQEISISIALNVSHFFVIGSLKILP